MISLDIDNPKPQGSKYVGKLRATDSKKNDYYLYDAGKNPDETDDEAQWRSTLMGIKFGSTNMESIGNIRTTHLHFHKLDSELEPFSEGINSIHYKDPSKVHADPDAI